MVQPVSSLVHSPAPEAQAAAARPAPSQPKPQTVAPAATVKLSSAASAIQEASETSVQTAREANAGDVQARNLLAREVAEKAESK